MILINTTHQCWYIFLAWYGKLHNANVSTTIISIRITPRRARSTLFDECEICVALCVPWRWWWKLDWGLHVVTTVLSESTETCEITIIQLFINLIEQIYLYVMCESTEYPITVWKLKQCIYWECIIMWIELQSTLIFINHMMDLRLQLCGILNKKVQ